MWRDYSASYIRKNRASSLSIIVAAFIATLFLSLICGLFFNFWVYDVERIVLDEGAWQGRVTGRAEEIDLAVIQNFVNVKKAVINEELSDEQYVTTDIYLKNTRRIFKDLPLIAKMLGLDEEAATYHLSLLSRYMIHDPQDEEPPLLMTFFLIILIIVSLSLILIIYNSFAVSMNARIRQFGIFSSIGATPGQIRCCLMQEAAALSAAPILAGGFCGIFLSSGAIEVINLFAKEIAGRHEAVWRYHPIVFIVTILVSALTVLISAWLPARRLSKLTPLQAIRSVGQISTNKKNHTPILSLIFGVEGELSGNALKAHKKSLRTSTLSLTLSFLGFTWMLCFFTLSEISTNHTYFERYQDVWDVMVTVKDTGIEDFRFTKELQDIQGVQDVVVYQKVAAKSRIPVEWQSDSLRALGGFETLTGTTKTEENDSFTAQTPIVILDDESFFKYCRQIGISPRIDGTIILNRIWDSANSNFRYKEYIPYLKETQKSIDLQDGETGMGSTELPILCFADNAPALREEYENYALVQFIPLSLWHNISPQLTDVETDTYIRVLAGDGVTHDELNSMEASISQIISHEYATDIENRIQEKYANKNMINGLMMILSAFCVLLAFMGIANVFSYTLGFLYQRKQEFAQYLSIGIAPESIKKMFCIEALVISVRPLIITFPLTVAAVAFFIKASYLNPMEFLAMAPIVPILVFILAIFGFVSLAYYIGGKRVLKCTMNS